VPERFRIVDRIAELVGPEALRITDGSSRWPAMAELAVDGAMVPVALYLSTVVSGGRAGRIEIERRLQNPPGGSPIREHRQRQALLLGLWERDEHIDVTRPLLISADPIRRRDKTTRFSVFVSVENLLAALTGGWSEETKADGELVRCFAPELLPASFEATTTDATPSAITMRAAIEDSGLLDADPIEAAGERARRAATALVRDARFACRVLDAYDDRCAMCGLGAGLVQAAHIYPVAELGSPDEPWNGLALCPNHHLAFDRHLIVIDPDTREIRLDLEAFSRGAAGPGPHPFVLTTYPKLVPPRDDSVAPRHEMLLRRYALSARPSRTPSERRAWIKWRLSGT
jgi:hypothetical protein